MTTKGNVKLMMMEMLREKKITGKYSINVYFRRTECADIYYFKVPRVTD